MRRLVLALLVLAACDNPPFALRFRLTTNEAQQCYSDTGNPTTSCQDITMLCDAYLSIRILSPKDPDAPFISVCKPLTGAQRKLCSIAGIDLPQPAMPVPEQTLEVQMAVFPSTAITTDPETGDAVCPRVEFAGDGLPVAVLPFCDDPNPFACPRVPAIGGRSYYHPGDDQTIVDLGCTDPRQLTDAETCTGVRRISVSASVNDFDDLVSSVDKATGDRLNVSIGEPVPLGGDKWVLNPGDSRELLRTTSTVPAWAGVLTDLEFTSSACVEVLEDGAETTTALSCRSVAPDKDVIDITGIFLRKTTLSRVLAAMGRTSFPSPGGLVIGVVIDEAFKPRTGVTVTPTCPAGWQLPCTVQYLNDTQTGLQSNGTGTSGIFVSTTTPYGTTYSIPSAAPVSVLGGVVEGKVTIVVIQDKVPVGGG